MGAEYKANFISVCQTYASLLGKHKLCLHRGHDWTGSALFEYRRNTLYNIKHRQSSLTIP